MKLRRLGSEDVVALVTPASPIAAEKLDFMLDVIRGMGYTARLTPHALDSDGFFAGSDETRAADLMAAFDDPEVTAVMCTRGGYGCSRLLPYLDFDRIVASRKMLWGFSDITILHAALNRRGMPTVHGPMALTMAYPREPWVRESIRRVLAGDLTCPADAPKPTTVVPGVAEGPVVGGCLHLLADTIGTAEPIDACGAILLLEEVDQAPHRVDANLTHLINAGVAGSAAGFLIGEMTRADQHVDPGIGGLPWREIVTERLAPLGKPMVIDFPLGHAKNMMSLPLGVRARLDADAGTLTYLEELCE